MSSGGKIFLTHPVAPSHPLHARRSFIYSLAPQEVTHNGSLFSTPWKTPVWGGRGSVRAGWWGEPSPASRSAAAPSRRPAALGAWMGGGRRAHAKSAKPAKEVGGMRKVKRGLSGSVPFSLCWCTCCCAGWRSARHGTAATRASREWSRRRSGSDWTSWSCSKSMGQHSRHPGLDGTRKPLVCRGSSASSRVPWDSNGPDTGDFAPPRKHAPAAQPSKPPEFAGLFTSRIATFASYGMVVVSEKVSWHGTWFRRFSPTMETVFHGVEGVGLAFVLFFLERNPVFPFPGQCFPLESAADIGMDMQSSLPIRKTEHSKPSFFDDITSC